MAITWSLALIVSAGLRFWGFQHPKEFIIRPVLVWILLFSPSVVLGLWLMLFSIKRQDS